MGVVPFVESLKSFPDPRDTRGKRHSLGFVVAGVVLAIMSGRSSASGIHRYIRNKIDWLCDILQMPDGEPISRSHLPRFLAMLAWADLNEIIEEHFNVRICLKTPGEWVAIDGKTLRGTTDEENKRGQRLLLAVTHTSRKILAQRPMSGPKSHEVPAVRELLRQTGLAKARVSLDALHCVPKTTSQVNLSGGGFIVQVKENQKKLKTQLDDLAADAKPLTTHTMTDIAHGRVEIRRAAFFQVNTIAFDEKWRDSGFQTLVTVKRTTRKNKNTKTTQELACYLTNQSVEKNMPDQTEELALAIRKHWSVEADNWIRDVTFKEDRVKTKQGNQAQVMASLRTLAMKLFRKANIKNFQEAIDNFADCSEKYLDFLKKVRFL